MSLKGKTILITGAARRVGKYLALTVAQAGGNVIIHHAHSPDAARQTASEVEHFGVRAWTLEADFSQPETVQPLLEHAARLSPLYGLVNSASIFEPLSAAQTSLAQWQKHMNINLTAPFLLSQAFAACCYEEDEAITRRIVNIVDWRALRPAADHFPYTISKAALAALTRSLAAAYAPRITVNGMALGAVLPPSDMELTAEREQSILKNVPAGRWARLEEVGQALLFLLDGPEYITGEILHIDGGRHLL